MRTKLAIFNIIAIIGIILFIFTLVSNIALAIKFIVFSVIFVFLVINAIIYYMMTRKR
ncbi:hypothetical protein [Staphylococcus hominis]|uniref:hypothetical protein n=1 Tax=Staphylococcus hominis TaxID=1290 RepID=UPI000AC4A502|nr:hypothetical protein [Staphylococcus hominis]